MLEPAPSLRETWELPLASWSECRQASSPLRFLGVASVAVPPGGCQRIQLLKALSQKIKQLHTSLLGSNSGEGLAILDTLLELLGLGDDGAELMFEAAGSVSATNRRHHVELVLGDGGVSKRHEQDGDNIRGNHLLTGSRAVGSLAHCCLWWTT